MSTPTIIANRYQLGDRTGSGAMGDVYRATDTQTGATVAIKALKPELLARDPDMLARFIREGAALRDLNHPNIVRMLDAVEQDGNHYLIMEYVPGGDLHGLLNDTSGGLPIDRALSIALDLADALTRAHRLDIIHRDLKPANVLLAEDGTPRLADFGIAHFAGQESFTQAGAIVGTWAYLSPEACLGQPLDGRADIWSFGVLLFELLAGRRPFMAGSPSAILLSILNQPLPDLQEIRSDVSDDLNDLLYRMLEKNRDARIPSVRLVGAEIEALLKGIDSTPTPRPYARPDSVFATPTPDTDERRHNLPAQTTPFVGRQDELAELSRLLTASDSRLVSLLGPGGMGKSRLSMALLNEYTQQANLS